MNSIRAITLDLDDTLWAIEPVIEKAERALWQFLADSYPRVAENFSAADVHDIRVSVMEEYTDYWHDFRFLRKKVLERIATSAGYSPDLVEPAFAIFDRARNDVELFPDVLPDLETLSQHFTLVALTNGNANLDTIGIGHFFEAVIAAADVGVSKPAKQIFDVAVATAGFHPSEVLHVGDHPETDIDGARAAGLRTAWMNRVEAEWPQHLPAPDTIVTTISELAAILEPARRAGQS